LHMQLYEKTGASETLRWLLHPPSNVRGFYR
jgi:hypothetical protein